MAQYGYGTSRVASASHVLLGDGQPIASVAWSSDPTKLLAASGKSVQVWHVDWELLPEPQ